MGLDGVELVMDVEEAFGIGIADDEAQRVTTVGDLHALVLSKLPGGRSGVCHTARAFYRLRRHAVEGLGRERRSVRLDAPTSAVLVPDGADTRESWRAAAAGVGLRLPDLELTRPVYVVLVAVGLAIFGAAVALAGWSAAGTATRVAAIPAAIGSVILLDRLGRPFRRVIPAKVATFGGLVEETAHLNMGALVRDTDHVDAPAVWRTLQRIVAEQLGVASERVTPEARFIQDLGLN